jgi:hypothetical protein
MPSLAYHVFVHRNGTYGVSLSQSGVIVRTESNFHSEAEAKTWIERDSRLTRDLSRQQSDEHEFDLHLG